jgi:hypothetical protein
MNSSSLFFNRAKFRQKTKLKKFVKASEARKRSKKVVRFLYLVFSV